MLCCILLGVLLSAGCSPGQAGPGQEGNADNYLVVFAAASLSGAFDEIIGQFEAAHPGVVVSANYAGSQQLAQQLAQGAPADLFASASEKQMDDAVHSLRINGAQVRPLVENQLAVIFRSDYPSKNLTLAHLALPGVKIALAGPSVPAGQYTLEFLDKAGAQPGLGVDFKRSVLANVASYEENVRAVLAKVALGEADAGIVYQSDLAGVPPGQVQQIDIPEHLNVKAAYLVAPVSGSQHPELARLLVEFALSPAGQEILKQHGFQPAR